MDISLTDSLVIIDEAHNIENVCRESFSFKASCSTMENFKHSVQPGSAIYIMFVNLLKMIKQIKLRSQRDRDYVTTGTEYLELLRKYITVDVIPPEKDEKIIRFMDKFTAKFIS